MINIAKSQQSSFGLIAGVTFASYKAEIEGISITAKSKAGFTAGVTSSIALGKNFSFQPGLHFVQKGGKLTHENVTDNTTLNYIELPLNFVYNTHSAKGKFFVGAGPALSMGISGKEKWDGEFPGDEDIKFGSGEEDDFKAFEAGINFLAGYQFKGGFFAAANYYTGLSNIITADDEFDTKYHNRYFGIRIGFMFPGKKK